METPDNSVGVALSDNKQILVHSPTGAIIGVKIESHLSRPIPRLTKSQRLYISFFGNPRESKIYSRALI